MRIQCLLLSTLHLEAAVLADFSSLSKCATPCQPSSARSKLRGPLASQGRTHLCKAAVVAFLTVKKEDRDLEGRECPLLYTRIKLGGLCFQGFDAKAGVKTHDTWLFTTPSSPSQQDCGRPKGMSRFRYDLPSTI